MILLLAHDPVYGAGSLRTMLERRGVAHRTLRLHLGDPIPDDVRRFKGIVSLGGPMNASDDRAFPFLRDEAGLLRAAVVSGVPILGLGLGARVLARALGGGSRRAPVEELGWGTVELTANGKRDRLFAGLGSPLTAFQWNAEALSLPPGAELLASATSSRNQAFRFALAWGVQFHPEIDAGMIEALSIGTERYVELRRSLATSLEAWRRRARILLGNFLALAAFSGQSS